MRSRRNPIYWDTVIDHGVIHDGEIVDDCGLFENRSNLVMRQSVMSQVAISEVVHGNESKMVRPKAEIEIHTDANAVEAQA